MSGHRKALPTELHEVIEGLDGVVAAARVTRCPRCRRRELGPCAKDTGDCPARSSGLAQLWNALGRASQAIGKTDLI